MMKLRLVFTWMLQLVYVYTLHPLGRLVSKTVSRNFFYIGATEAADVIARYFGAWCSDGNFTFHAFVRVRELRNYFMTR